MKENIPHAIARDRSDTTGSRGDPEPMVGRGERRPGTRRLPSAAGALLSTVAYFCLRLIEIAGIVIIVLGLFALLIFGTFCTVR